MFGDAEHYKYLTNEADLNNLADDAMALTPKTPKKVRERQTSFVDRFWVLNNCQHCCRVCLKEDTNATGKELATTPVTTLEPVANAATTTTTNDQVDTSPVTNTSHYEVRQQDELVVTEAGIISSTTIIATTTTTTITNAAAIAADAEVGAGGASPDFNDMRLLPSDNQMANSLANMSMTESMTASGGLLLNNYESTKNVSHLDADNSMNAADASVARTKTAG